MDTIDNIVADLTPPASAPPHKRRMNPNSLKNIEGHKVQKGQILNPRGINSRRPYSLANLAQSTAHVPEEIRLYVNATINQRLGMYAPVGDDGKQFEALKKGITWAKAMAMRFHLAALLSGDVAAGKEVRESVEGKAAQRMEITGGEGEPLHAPDVVVNFIDTYPALPPAPEDSDD